MKYSIIGLLFLFSLNMIWAQSIPELEKQLQEATNAQEKITINQQLANAYLTTDVEKALNYAKAAARESANSGNKVQAAASNYLIATIAERKKDMANFRVYMKYAINFAKEANDLDMLARSTEKLSAYYAKNREYDDAFKHTSEAFRFVNSKGYNMSDLENKYNTQRMSLDREKRNLESQISQMQGRLADLSAEKNQLSTEKSKLEEKQEELVKENLLAEEVITRKEEDIMTISKAKNQAEDAAKAKEAEVKQLSRENLEQQLVLKVKEASLAEAQLEAELQKNEVQARNKFVQLSGLVALFFLLLSVLLFGRFKAKQKSEKTLGEKNKIIEQEKSRNEELLLNILPKNIADELKASGKAKARRYDQVTVLFSDFVNFTKIAEQLSPEELVEELDKCFKAFDHIIKQYPDIEKIKTIGDAYMCASGLSERKGLPNNLIQAALDMQSYLHEYKELRIKQGKPYFEARIGMHTGPVVAGVVGDIKFAYDIWGDTVNLASRIESNSEAGQVNISQDTYNLIRYRYECNYRGKMPAKNKGELDMYYVHKKSSVVEAS
ncbi:MAG TPA: adenylate/guanylate cyclase domain-containing protein [Haliscomenobacter sp.]|uniref:adenylate/guanylate cyclase domain-containing protein n=1 Tax=Haliscomenobacter sp. TaxID=2717303 RepID=UPI002D0FD22E|nr:adenylate/guanylate cyclase domain-containing protein [Haliscomenobacter sp.]HOY18889.1 adenylate/guanylate cyclase domain-containing protein [Haliscomenobacter sp.]HPH17849.1 adenylate/guanylate cyclase domain-containing protein [Haliscomenobacter sp.]